MMKSSYISIFIIISLVQLASCTTHDEAFAKPILAEHNQRRCMHDVKFANFNYDVASNAQEHSDTKGQFNRHAQNPTSYKLASPYGPAGENLYSGLWGGTSAISGAVASWYSEYDDAGLATQWKTTASEFERLNALHFTALVWKDVTQIGCGWNPSAGTGENQNYWVCRYKSDDAGAGNPNLGEDFSTKVLKRGTTSETDCTANALSYWNASRKLLSNARPAYASFAALVTAVGSDAKAWMKTSMSLTEDEAVLMMKHMDRDDNDALSEQELELFIEDGWGTWGSARPGPLQASAGTSGSSGSQGVAGTAGITGATTPSDAQAIVAPLSLLPFLAAIAAFITL